jgi:hypothetical protein
LPPSCAAGFIASPAGAERASLAAMIAAAEREIGHRQQRR